jgi:hypothetical protein
MTPLLLLERLKIFQNLLIENVKQIHQNFLKSIGVTNISSNSIKRWHPKFDLEEIEDIIAVELPQKPNELKLTTGEDLKKIAKEVYSVRVESAIESVLKKQEKIVEILSIKSQEVPKNATLKEKQSIEYTNLLERIRAKERYKDVEKMILNSDKEKRVQLLEKYGDCVRFVKSYFYAEKKATIDLETVCKKLHDSLKCYTANEYEEIIRELCKDFTKWINIIKVRQQQYVKIDKHIELHELLKKISSMIEEAKA